jgi:uncharacterized protein (TIGR03083 family)
MQNVPIPTIHLFQVLERKLIELLRSLSEEEWQLPTITKQWNVKDVAAHLLDTSIRAIAANDGHSNPPTIPIHSYNDLVAYLNNLNADWVKAMKRVSPQVLTDWIASATGPFIDTLKNKDPFAPAAFSVAWAGEDRSLNWFHIAREYTERWHHQQQIRDAVNKPGILTKELYYPVMDTFMMALPHTYRHTNAKENTLLQVTISGDAGGDWFLIKKDQWHLQKENMLPVTTQVIIDQNMAWKLFTKSWRKRDVIDNVKINGDTSLAEPALGMIAVMA